MKRKMRAVRTRRPAFAVCVDNTNFPASLEQRKIYRVVPDPQAHDAGLIRVIDESGEDYLYPKSVFRPIALTTTLRRALRIPAAS